MRVHVVLEESGADVDGGGDADFVAGVHLGAQQLEVEVRVSRGLLGVEVRVAVVPVGEKGDGVHVGGLEGLLPLFFVEGLADAWDQRGGVEVEVDLAKAHGWSNNWVGVRRGVETSLYFILSSRNWPVRGRKFANFP